MLDNGSYHRTDGTDDTWTADTFTAASVVLRRRGSTTAHTERVYAGNVANDGLINVTVNGVPTAGSTPPGEGRSTLCRHRQTSTISLTHSRYD